MHLSETTIIAASPRKVFAFFVGMEENYLRWHRDHIVFRWLDKGRQEVGSRFYFEERIHGQILKRVMFYTKVETNQLIEFVPDNPVIRFFLRSVRFEMLPVGDGCRFTQTLHIRIGPIGHWLNRRGFEAVEKHMREEGENLKAILEEYGLSAGGHWKEQQ